MTCHLHRHALRKVKLTSKASARRTILEVTGKVKGESTVDQLVEAMKATIEKNQAKGKKVNVADDQHAGFVDALAAVDKAITARKAESFGQIERADTRQGSRGGEVSEDAQKRGRSRSVRPRCGPR